jgi:hypothetical protein
MSDFIRALNLIKTERETSWLTQSQEEALITLREMLRVPGRVNLSGSAGVGKTFLAWTLADELGYAYFAHPVRFEEVRELDVLDVIIDNAQPGRWAHRRVLKEMSFKGVRHAVLITRQPVRDYIHCVELALTPSDQAKVRDNLASVGLFQPAIDVSTLWFLVNPSLGGERDA